MSKSFIFFVVIISCRALKETNNVAWFFVGFFFFASPVPEIYFSEFFLSLYCKNSRKTNYSLFSFG